MYVLCVCVSLFSLFPYSHGPLSIISTTFFLQLSLVLLLHTIPVYLQGQCLKIKSHDHNSNCAFFEWSYYCFCRKDSPVKVSLSQDRILKMFANHGKILNEIRRHYHGQDFSRKSESCEENLKIVFDFGFATT
jgi:hypothetical protein